MANNIVTVNVSVTAAPTPSTLQRTGAFVTQGGTTTVANTLTLLTQLADLTAIIAPAKALTSLTWSGSVATGTTTAPHGWTNADVITGVIAGAVPTGYNGTYQITITGASTFTYPLVVNPGSETTPGTVQLGAAVELLAMGTTFFAQGSGLSVYALELGEATAADGVTALTTWLTNNPNLVYSLLMPAEFTGATGFATLVSAYEGLTAKTYFFCTATTGNYSDFTSLQKSAFVEIEAPLTPATEFSLAAAFFTTLNYNPSSANQVTPTAFSFQYGVTSYPPAGNATLFASLKAAGVNIIGTAAEGGLSTACLFWGTTMDGKDFTYWYSVDWVQINSQQAIANEVINGSNNALAPLYYNQNGINRLQAREAQVMGQAVSYGLALGVVIQTQLPFATFQANVESGVYAGQVAVNAEPFAVYTSENPNDYAIGKYAGLSVAYTPTRGFKQIIVGVNVTDFPGA